MSDDELIKQINTFGNFLSNFSKAMDNFRLVGINVYTQFMERMLHNLFPYADIEVKLINGNVKVISDKELYGITGDLIGRPLVSFRKYQTCVIYNFGYKKEPEKMLFIASTKFPPYDLCLHSSCDNCVFSEYHTGYNPRYDSRIRRMI